MIVKIICFYNMVININNAFNDILLNKMLVKTSNNSN